MTKKLWIILGALGVIFIGCVALCGGLLFWAQRAGTELQRKFFTALESGDAKQVQALLHPALREEVDEPVLAAWMAELHKDLGNFQGLSKTDFSTSTKYEGGVTVTESKGTVNFENGTATSELVFRDGQLVKLSVESDKIPRGWFKGPADSAMYRERGKEFFTHLLNNEPDQAFHMMHKALQTSVPLEKLEAMASDVVSKAGKLESITYAKERFDKSEGQRLKIVYNVQCEQGRTTAAVEFQFVGLKGHILAFDLPAKE